jgi:hypothetical protein
LKAISWTSIWADEFTSLSASRWGYDTMDGCQISNNLCGWGNAEKVWYTKSTNNVRVSSGKLIIQARAETGATRQTSIDECWAECVARCGKSFTPGVPEYDWCIGDCGNTRCPAVEFTSGKIKTLGKFTTGPNSTFPIIKVEARIKLPSRATCWPAFWMLPAASPYAGWPQSGEIDIMEQFNNAATAIGSLHYGGAWPAHEWKSASKAFDPSIYHTYRVQWSTSQIEWFLDGVLFHTVKSQALDPGGWWSGASDGNAAAPFDVPFYIIFNLAVGGAPLGSPSAATIRSALGSGGAEMAVDWVRVHGGRYA